MKYAYLVVSIFLASCTKDQVPAEKQAPAPAAATKENRAAALALLESKPAWLPALGVDICPLDVMPKDLAMKPFTPGRCKGDALWSCVDECRLGNGVSCYAAATELQKPGAPDELTEALFLRGCMNGDPGSCTNRTIGRVAQRENAVDECTVRTFRKVCAAQDPWACAMLASSLLQLGNSEEVQSAVESACNIAPNQDPCTAAKNAVALKREGPSTP